MIGSLMSFMEKTRVRHVPENFKDRRYGVKSVIQRGTTLSSA